MGLDMYLTRKHYIGGKWEWNNVKGTIDISTNGKKIPIDLKKVTYIDEEVGYWRKANAIHKWFVDNVQGGEDDCRPYYVEAEQLQQLLDICKEVRKKAIIVNGKVCNGETLKDGKWEKIYQNGKTIENAEEISKILPTQSGFFFGCTDYDEYYMNDIYDTIEILEKVLKENKELEEQKIYPEYQYRASW